MEHQSSLQKKDGVRPEYNVRTDRWDIALDAMSKIDMARKARAYLYGVAINMIPH